MRKHLDKSVLVFFPKALKFCPAWDAKAGPPQKCQSFAIVIFENTHKNFV